MEIVETGPAETQELDQAVSISFGMLMLIKEKGTVHRDLLFSGIQMSTGLSEERVNALEYTLIRTGLIRREGFILSLTPEGVVFLGEIEKI